MIISSFTYSYDNVGNRLSMATTEGNHSYSYDDNYQLTNVTYPDSSTTTYNYDELGNRITVTEGGATDTYASNNLNQYTQVNSVPLTYDLNGSLTGDGSWTYSYDYEGRMVSTEKIGSSVSYSYDDFGRRIKKNVNSLITNYLYDGSQCVLEKDNGGTTQARYVYGSRIDEPIIMIRDGNTYYYHFDGLGNVVDITNSLGVTVESYTYDVFGKVSVENPHVNPPIPNPNPHIPPRNPRIPPPPKPIGNPYFFTGRRLDTETGLYYYRARYYDPGMGRFLQVDPVGYREGYNLYTYVRNNPIKYVDPYGLGASGGPEGGDGDELYSFNWEEWLKLIKKFGRETAQNLLSSSGLTLSTLAMFVEDPMLGALGISLGVHGLLLEEGSTGGRFLSGAGAITGAVGFLTGNPFLMALGVSISAHGLAADMPSPFGNLDSEPTPQTYDTEISYIGEIP